MEYLYYICDVFTDEQFGGNQLAVFPDARGLSDTQMQQIAREFNFSETTFVLPAEQKGCTRRVRIFTPAREMAFAGHPNIGTAFVLAMTDPVLQGADSFVFEEIAGQVTVTLDRRGSVLFCELRAPKPLMIGEEVPINLIADALTIPPSRIMTSRHLPRVCSVGMPFIMAELENESVLKGVRLNNSPFRSLERNFMCGLLHVYVERRKGHFNTRMFAPLHGVHEDPATGSANCALAGLLLACDTVTSDMRSYHFTQGLSMGRPSRLTGRAHKEENTVVDTWIGGNSVMVSQGTLFLEPAG